MRLFGKKSKKTATPQKKTRSKMNKQKIIWIFILLTVPLGFLLKESLQWYAIKERMVLQEKENAQIQQQIAKLELEKEKFKKADPETIEKQAREKLNFTRPGEQVYVPSTTQ
jgi:cell division protein FtsB